MIETVCTTFPRVDNWFKRSPRAVRLGYTTRIIVTWLFKRSKSIVHKTDNLVANSRVILPVRQFAQPKTSFERLAQTFPLSHITTVDAVHSVRNKQVGRSLYPSRILVQFEQFIHLLVHPLVYLGLCIIAWRATLIYL